MPGRLARGETLVFSQYQSCIEMADSDGLLLYDTCPHPTEVPALPHWSRCVGRISVLGQLVSGWKF